MLKSAMKDLGNRTYCTSVCANCTC